jgi:hypothetical protein
MDTFSPAVAQLLLQCAAGEVQPRSIEVIARCIQPGSPDQGWSIIDYCAETLLAFRQRTVHPGVLNREPGSAAEVFDDRDVVARVRLVIGACPTGRRLPPARRSENGNQRHA